MGASVALGKLVIGKNAILFSLKVVISRKELASDVLRFISKYVEIKRVSIYILAIQYFVRLS
jgi:hypothetical protein